MTTLLHWLCPSTQATSLFPWVPKLIPNGAARGEIDPVGPAAAAAAAAGAEKMFATMARRMVDTQIILTSMSLSVT
jgi:hypothetical protein